MPFSLAKRVTIGSGAGVDATSAGVVSTVGGGLTGTGSAAGIGVVVTGSDSIPDSGAAAACVETCWVSKDATAVGSSGMAMSSVERRRTHAR